MIRSDSTDPLRLLVLGDSYAAGEGVAAAQCWPEQLAARWRAQGLSVAPVEIIAATGWNASELRAAIRQRAPQGQFDQVFLAVGVNDQYRGLDRRNYGRHFARLLDRAAALAGHRRERVRVLSIPDWGVTPFAGEDRRGRAPIAVAIDRFNRLAKRLCRRRGIAFIDITERYRARAAEAHLLAADGLHPSAAMYALWVDWIGNGRCDPTGPR